MDKETFETIDPILDDVAEVADKLLKSAATEKLRSLLTDLNNTLGSRYLVSIHVNVTVCNTGRQRSFSVSKTVTLTWILTKYRLPRVLSNSVNRLRSLPVATDFKSLLATSAMSSKMGSMVSNVSLSILLLHSVHALQYLHQVHFGPPQDTELHRALEAAGPTMALVASIIASSRTSACSPRSIGSWG